MDEKVVARIAETIGRLRTDLSFLSESLKEVCTHKDIRIVKTEDSSTYDVLNDSHKANVFCNSCCGWWSFDSVTEPEEYADPAAAVSGSMV